MVDIQLSSSAVNSGNVTNLWGTQITPAYSKNFDSPAYIGTTGSSDAVSEVNVGVRENPQIAIEGTLNVDKTDSSYPTITKLKNYWKQDTVYLKDGVYFTDWTKIVITSIKFNRTPEYREKTKGNIINYNISAIQTL